MLTKISGYTVSQNFISPNISHPIWYVCSIEQLSFEDIKFERLVKFTIKQNHYVSLIIF